MNQTTDKPKPETVADLMPQTPDLRAERLATLRKLFPDLFDGEGRLQEKELRALIDPAYHPAAERYEFQWTGKTRSKREAFTPSRAALVYDEKRSVNPDKAGGNVIIEGENLEVLKLLTSAYRERVKLIYIDPPYNTGKDFVYSDDYTEGRKPYWEESGVTERGVKVDTNSDSEGRYHSNWLSMMHARLLAARYLLHSEGVMFVSIDDNEVANLLRLMQAVFGEENYVTTLIWNKQHSQQQGLFKRYHEYIVVFARSEETLKGIAGGSGIIEAGALKKISSGNPKSSFTFPAGVKFEAPDGTTFTGTFGDAEKVTVEDGVLEAKAGKTVSAVTLAAGWTQKNQMTKWFAGEEVRDTKGQRIIEFYFNSAGKLKCRKERTQITPPTILPAYGMVSEQTDHVTSLFGAPVFDRPKPVNMIADFIRWFTDDGDIVLDFFAGSGTSGEAVLKLNADDDAVTRQFILVQLPEFTKEDSAAYKAGYKKISDITIERNKRVIERYRKAADGLLPTDPKRQYAESLGFKVYTLEKSHFPRVDFAPDPDKTEAENVELLKAYIKEKENTFHRTWDRDRILDEVLLKNGFMFDRTIEPAPEFTKNKVELVKDAHRSALVCLDESIAPETVDAFKGDKERTFICLEAALDTTKKWNLKHHLGDRLRSI